MMGEWQPISTAPKDGRHILVGYGFRPDDDLPAVWWIDMVFWQFATDIWWTDRSRRPKKRGWWVVTPSGDDYPAEQATHWHPLPAREGMETMGTPMPPREHDAQKAYRDREKYRDLEAWIEGRGEKPTTARTASGPKRRNKARLND